MRCEILDARFLEPRAKTFKIQILETGIWILEFGIYILGFYINLLPIQNATF